MAKDNLTPGVRKIIRLLENTKQMSDRMVIKEMLAIIDSERTTGALPDDKDIAILVEAYNRGFLK